MALLQAPAYRPFAHTNTFKPGFNLRPSCSTIELPAHEEWKAGRTRIALVSNGSRPKAFDLAFGGECRNWSDSFNLGWYGCRLYLLGYPVVYTYW